MRAPQWLLGLAPRLDIFLVAEPAEAVGAPRVAVPEEEVLNTGVIQELYHTPVVLGGLLPGEDADGEPTRRALREVDKALDFLGVGPGYGLAI